jgi:PhnB protein
MSPTNAKPQGYHSITPSLTCKNAADAIDYYTKVFGAKELFRMAAPGGKIGHAELTIGDSRIFVNDEFGPSASGTPGMSLFLYVDDVDSVFNKAVSTGSQVLMPLDNQFWGDRFGRVSDPFGHHWGLATHVEDVAPDEMERRAAEWMKKAAAAQG